MSTWIRSSIPGWSASSGSTPVVCVFTPLRLRPGGVNVAIEDLEMSSFSLNDGELDVFDRLLQDFAQIGAIPGSGAFEARLQ